MSDKKAETMDEKNQDSQSEELNQDSQENAEKKETEESSAEESQPDGDKKYQELEQKYQELSDKYQRIYAEFENFRRRTAKENVELMTSANADLVGKLVEVMDNFDRAFDPQNKTTSLEDFEKGIKLIYQRFKQILDESGLEEIDPQGEEFDPNLHDALMQQPNNEIPENHIAMVFQKGYKLKGRIIEEGKDRTKWERLSESISVQQTHAWP